MMRTVAQCIQKGNNTQRRPPCYKGSDKHRHLAMLHECWLTMFPWMYISFLTWLKPRSPICIHASTTIYHHHHNSLLS